MPSVLPLFVILAALGMVISQYFIVIYAPMEQSMGMVQKIFYVHVPLSWWAFVSFFVVFVASIAYLRTKSPTWDAWAKAAAEIGVLFTSLALITGSIWARHSWGVWWTWDPRLTTALIMWFVYVAYLIVRGMDMAQERNAVIRGVLGIIAFLDVPLVFFSARLWRTIHPAVFTSKGSGLDEDMLTALLVCLASFGCLCISLILLRARQLMQKATVEELFSAHSKFEA